jgi:aminoglycoside phosphotransferase (APT) family kinase protein
VEALPTASRGRPTTTDRGPCRYGAPVSTPVGPIDLTPAWLSVALDTEVTACTVATIGTGQTGSSYRLAVTYADHSSLPTSFVAKLGAEDPEVRQRVAYAYRAEVGFYRTIASTLRVPVPHIFASDISDDAATFVLLMQDLAPAVQGDQIAGCTPAVAEVGARALAGLHGPRWCDPSWRDVDFLTMPVATVESATGMGELARVATDVFLDTLGERMTDEDRTTLRAFPDAVAEWLLASPERFALLHGDFRLDNLMLSPDGAVTVVDWQTLTVGLPARDLAYWVSTSLSPHDRRASEAAVVAAYHQALAIPDYPLAVCEADYRIGQLQTPLIATLGWAFTTQTPRGADMMLAMIARSCAAIRDLKTLEAL